MNRIWTSVLLAACVIAVWTGNGEAAGRAMAASGAQAVSLGLTLCGSMALWSGVLAILEETGDAERLSQLLQYVLRPLFPTLRDEDAWAAVSLNLSANILGLGNAATPAGIRAARLLSAQGEPGLRALAMLLALNNSSLQLAPTTVITLRAAAGSVSPGDVWPAALMSSLAATITAAGAMWIIQRGGERNGDHGGGGSGGASGRALRQ